MERARALGLSICSYKGLGGKLTVYNICEWFRVTLLRGGKARAWCAGEIPLALIVLERPLGKFVSIYQLW